MNVVSATHRSPHLCPRSFFVVLLLCVGAQERAQPGVDEGHVDTMDVVAITGR
ncbi:MAG: hypothetical protein VYE68_06020 [Acidobacteriota bacterium]|nr:hypothetical protein [Acidobacteriota bacterium]